MVTTILPNPDAQVWDILLASLSREARKGTPGDSSWQRPAVGSLDTALL